MSERKLADHCYTCNSEEVFEETYGWKGEELALSLCPNCRKLNDWELPKQLQNYGDEGEENQELFEEVAEYAEQDAKSMMIAKGLWFQIHISRFAEERLPEKIIEDLKEIANLLMGALDMQDCYIGISGKGVNFQVV